MTTFSNEPPTAQEDESAVLAWLRQNALPLQHLEAGNGFADLQPLKQILRDVKIVGLGETTHGTREAFLLKHRLVEFLVSEMGFTIFTIEASYSACQPINDYVLYGRGERAAVLTSQFYIPWDTEEFSALLDWLRAYNRDQPDEKKVRFQGLDITRNDIGRQSVLDYLRQVAPEQVEATQALFAALVPAEGRWPRRQTEESKKSLAELLPQLQALEAYLAENRARLVRSSSTAGFERAMRYLWNMRQFIQEHGAAFLPAVSPPISRATGLGENLIYLAERAAPEAKFIVWAHNGHIKVSDDPLKPNLGSLLRARYGAGYYCFGFEFNQGAFLTRLVTQESLLAELRVTTLPPAPEKSLPWLLAQVPLSAFLLNLHAHSASPAVARWLATPLSSRSIGWAYSPAIEQGYLGTRAPNIYDGIIFFESTTASRPTPNALRTAAALDGL